MNLSSASLTIEQWGHTINELLDNPSNRNPIINVNKDDDREFDAIFLGGGAGGRFGSAYLRAMGGVN